MNSSSYLLPRWLIAGFLLALLGACASSDVSWSTEQGAVKLAGRKTFRVAGPTGADASFRGESFSDSVTLAIIARLKELGYAPVTDDASDLLVAWSYQFATTGNPAYFATPAQQPGGPPPTIQTVGLSIDVSGGDGGKTLWQASAPFPVARATWSPEGNVNLVKQTLHGFPPYREAATAPAAPDAAAPAATAPAAP